MSSITKISKITLVVGALLVLTGSFLFGGTKVLAAACTNTSNYGVATMTVAVPAAGEYRVWSRMKVPSSSASSYQLEADGNTCWQVGGSNVPTNTWTWVDWYGGSSTQKINYTFSAGNHTLKLIGSSTNVQVDKVILLGTGEQCSDSTTTPSGDGSNCANGPTATTTPGGTTTQPPVTSGTTTPSIVEENKANAVQTSYIIDGKVVQTSPGAAPLDTSKLADGTYSVETVVNLKDGTEVKATEVIAVKNKKSFIQKNHILIIALAIILAVGLFLLWRIFFRGSFPLVANLFQKKAGSNTAAPTSSPLQGYAEPQVIVPDKPNDTNHLG